MTNIRVHNPCNSHTRYYRNYNLFWDKFTDYLKEYFVVEENRYFEDAHSSRFKVELQKGQSSEFLLLECEYVIENLDNGEFVIMSVADDLTHAILNEKDNPFLKKVLISQFDPTKISQHIGKHMYKYSPWTYFQAGLDDIEEYYTKRCLIKDFENKIYFKGTSLEDRSILNYIDKSIITDFTPIPQPTYFNDLISHKLALSVDGRGEFCYRDVECFGVGIPILRFEYLSIFNQPLVPNYHYISIPRPSDMVLYRSGKQDHAELIKNRYFEVIEDVEFLNFISDNARKYYSENFELNSKLSNTFNILNLNSWL